MGQRLLAVDVQAAVHGPDAARAWTWSAVLHDHRVEVLLVDASSASRCRSWPWGTSWRPRPGVLVDVAQGDDVLAADSAHVGPPRPATPMMPMFSFSLGDCDSWAWSRRRPRNRGSGQAALLRNSRRLLRVFIGRLLGHWGFAGQGEQEGSPAGTVGAREMPAGGSEGEPTSRGERQVDRLRGPGGSFADISPGRLFQSLLASARRRLPAAGTAVAGTGASRKKGGDHAQRWVAHVVVGC